MEEDWNGRDEWRKKILGGRDSRTDGGKGTSGRRLEWQRRMEKEDTISVQWAQEDVETSYNLLNNNIIQHVIQRHKTSKHKDILYYFLLNGPFPASCSPSAGFQRTPRK